MRGSGDLRCKGNSRRKSKFFRILGMTVLSWIVGFIVLYLLFLSKGLGFYDIFINKIMLPGFSLLSLSIIISRNAAYPKSIIYIPLSLFTFLLTLNLYIYAFGKESFKSPITDYPFIDNRILLGGIFLISSFIFYIVFLIAIKRTD